MSKGDKFIIPAMAAGFFSMKGQISIAGNSVTIPEGMVNIGGNMFGYLIAAATIDPFAAINRDNSYSSLTLGDDIYIYACQHASGVAKIVCSKNSTSPAEYNTTNSRKIGGFHVGRTRPYSARYDAAYLPVTSIVPNSIWDLQHRPRCEPTGMVEISPGGLWVDIYLNSVISGSWPEVVFGSRFGVQPVRSTGGYNELDLGQGILNAGKRLPDVEEFVRYAYGAPPGADGNNNTAWAAATNTGPTTTGNVQRSVSCCNVADAVGNLWERLNGHFDLGNTTNAFAWDPAVVNTGQDASMARGQVNNCVWRSVLGGGYWSVGTRCGARALNFDSNPCIAGGGIGVRGVSDPL
nr:hypothetical protein [Plesiomonas shigelloides]